MTTREAKRIKNELIALREYLEQKEEGSSIPYSFNDACNFVTGEAFNKDVSKLDKDKWMEFIEKNRVEFEFIRLLFIDILIVST